MEEPIKRKRGRPKGYSPKQKMNTYNTDGVETLVSVPAPDPNGKTPRQLDLANTGRPTTMLPRNEEAAAVPNMIRTILAIRESVDLDNPQTIWNALEMYVGLCANSGMKITNGTMYMACGVDRRTIHDWEYGIRRQNNPEYRKIAQMAKTICAAAREQYGVESQVNPIITIFHQKFYDGFKDNPPDEAAENPLGEITDPQKLAEKYKDIIVD